MESIIPVPHLIGGNCFNVSSGEIKRVYDTCESGALVSVEFEQTGQAIYLLYAPVGQIYYRYKKSK